MKIVEYMKMWSKQSQILFMINNKKEDTWIKKTNKHGKSQIRKLTKTRHHLNEALPL